MCELVCQIVQKKQEEKRIEEEQAANARYWKIPACCDDDDEYDSAITPVLSTEEPIDSLSISDTMCDVHLDNNHTPLKAKNHLEIVLNSNDDISSSDDDSLHEENIDTTAHSDISLPDYEAFYFDDDHVKKISSGSTTNHSDISLSEYDLFIFDLTHEEFVDELARIISLPEYDCFYFRDLPDPGELMSVLNSRIRENLSTTLVNLPIEDDYSPLLAYVV
nr:hypothetical protein [Tanacetum cinerariifolium]